MDPIDPISPRLPPISGPGAFPVEEVPRVSRERDHPARERPARERPPAPGRPQRGDGEEGEEGEGRHVDVRA
jgi:hypothetical protein